MARKSCAYRVIKNAYEWSKFNFERNRSLINCIERYDQVSTNSFLSKGKKAF